MPTPNGSRGGMAFSAAELHVLRRSLAHALQPSSAPLAAEEVQDCLRLAQSVDEAAREAGRLRAFVLDDLARYRGALPGSLSGYLELLRQALAAGYEPTPTTSPPCAHCGPTRPPPRCWSGPGPSRSAPYGGA